MDLKGEEKSSKITIDQGEQLWRAFVESSSGADDARRIFIMPQQIQSLRQSGCFTLGLNSFRGSIKDHFSLSLPPLLSSSPFGRGEQARLFTGHFVPFAEVNRETCFR